MHRLLREDFLMFEQTTEATECSTHVREYLLMNERAFQARKTEKEGK